MGEGGETQINRRARLCTHRACVQGKPVSGRSGKGGSSPFGIAGASEAPSKAQEKK